MNINSEEIASKTTKNKSTNNANCKIEKFKTLYCNKICFMRCLIHLIFNLKMYIRCLERVLLLFTSPIICMIASSNSFLHRIHHLPKQLISKKLQTAFFTTVIKIRCQLLYLTRFDKLTSFYFLIY